MTKFEFTIEVYLYGCVKCILSVLEYGAALTKYHRLSGLSPKTLFSLFGRLEVQDQSVDMFGSF